jgi:hypothetical protein
MIVFEHEAGIEQHHGHTLGQAVNNRLQRRPDLRRVGQRPRRVELHRHVFARQQRRIDDLARLLQRVSRVSIDEAHPTLP